MPKTVTACVKVTHDEAAYLINLGGSLGKGLRELINARRIPTTDTDDLKAILTADLATALDIPVEVLTAHRHRRGALLRTDFVGGTKVKTYKCDQCDQEMT